MPLPITNRLKEAVEYVNYHYYSKEMTVKNYNHFVFPIPSALPIINGDNQNDAAIPLRINHGILHASAAMELISDIHDSYKNNYGNYERILELIASHFEIEVATLLEYIQLAALFHDTGRKGDGIDLWDEISAQNCKKYMIENLGVAENLADFISNTVRFKDSAKEFLKAHSAISNKFDFKDNEIDIVRQLVNTADTLEVMRVRNDFNPNYLPIAAHQQPLAMQAEVIPNLVVLHRQRIIDEGRNRRAARIKKCAPIYYDDSKYQPPKKGTDEQLYATYMRKNQMYDLTVENITLDNLDKVVQRALRGIETYINKNGEAKFRLYHNGFFGLRYHGKTGNNRAKFFQTKLTNAMTNLEKAELLYAIFAFEDGRTLKEEIMRSFNNMNEASILRQLSTLLRNLANNDEYVIAGVNDRVITMITASTL